MKFFALITLTAALAASQLALAGTAPTQAAVVTDKKGPTDTKLFACTVEPRIEFSTFEWSHKVTTNRASGGRNDCTGNWWLYTTYPGGKFEAATSCRSIRVWSSSPSAAAADVHSMYTRYARKQPMSSDLAPGRHFTKDELVLKCTAVQQ